MKNFLTIIATVLVAWLVCSSIYSVKIAIRAFWLVSAVKVPGGKAIADIQGDLEAGRYELAKEKMSAFAGIWSRFNRDSDANAGLGIGDVLLVLNKVENDFETNHPSISNANATQKPKEKSDSQ